MIYETTVEGLPVRTGDIVCTRNGAPGSLAGVVWRAIGQIVPGEVDHCALYVGPGGRYVEAGARGVMTFEMPEGRWDAAALGRRRWVVDQIVGVAYPLEGRGLAEEDEAAVRADVARFCLERAEEFAPYNPNFFDATAEGAFYCSQLIYLAYLPHGIDLNANRGGPLIEHLEHIVFPHEIWHALPRRRADDRPLTTDEGQMTKGEG